MVKINYDDLLDISKLEDVYHTIKLNSKHRSKIVTFEMFKSANFAMIYSCLENKNYTHGKYNIFIITNPKVRIIMSENMSDKIINHLISKFVLFPLIEPRLIDVNVATRQEKGSKAAILYMKKYINKLKINNDKIYALKCDIHKFFYSIDHEILLNKLKYVIEDHDLFNLVRVIVNSTDYEYINNLIDIEMNRTKKFINKLPISEREKEIKINDLLKIPKHRLGKGLPIGSMTSQIMAVFYLNDLDHFIKEKLKVKYYIRYMDDLILIHTDREYLKYCLNEIDKEVKKIKLELNNKTQIYDLNHGIPFLGYKFVLKNKKLFVLLNNRTKKRIRKNIKRFKKGNNRDKKIMDYNGYLIYADCGSFLYNLKKVR